MPVALTSEEGRGHSYPGVDIRGVKTVGKFAGNWLASPKTAGNPITKRFAYRQHVRNGFINLRKGRVFGTRIPRLTCRGALINYIRIFFNSPA